MNESQLNKSYLFVKLSNNLSSPLYWISKHHNKLGLCESTNDQADSSELSATATFHAQQISFNEAVTWFSYELESRADWLSNKTKPNDKRLRVKRKSGFHSLLMFGSASWANAVLFSSDRSGVSITNVGGEKIVDTPWMLKNTVLLLWYFH